MDTLIRHPWFRMPSLKRKTPEVDELLTFRPSATSIVTDNLDPSCSFSPLSASKRRRFDMLEQGLAHLSLAGAHEDSSTVHLREQEPAVPENKAVNLALDGSVLSVSSARVLPITPEMPATSQPLVSKEVEDVQMIHPTWYEPEKDRIVVTDLDDSDEELEFIQHVINDSCMPQELLRHLRAQILCPSSQVVISGVPISRLKFNNEATEPKNYASLLPEHNVFETSTLSSPSLLDDAMEIE